MGESVRLFILYCLLQINLFYIITSCDSNPIIDYNVNPSQTIVSTIYGSFNGIKLYDACTFTLIDSISTPLDAPTFVENTNDGHKLFSVLNDDNANNFLISLSTNPLSIVQIVPCIGWRVTKNFSDDILFVYGGFYNTLQLFNLESLSVLREQQISKIGLMISSPTENKMYGLRADEGYSSIFIYNIDSLSIIEEIQFSSIAEIATDISVSNDDRFVFFTTFLGSSSFLAKFYAFDTQSRSIVSEIYCPPFASVGVSPDGKSVYITDPAGYLYELPSSGKLLRYDVETRSMNVFIDWVPYNLTSAFEGRLPTKKVIVSPDNRYLYITTSAARTETGKSMDILKVNVRNKKVINFLSIPHDYRGYKTEIINNIKLINN